MIEQPIDPITISLDENDKCIATFIGPSRKFGNLREELTIDAKNISNRFGHVYVALSGGMDSQIIVRCLQDVGADFTPFFIHSIGCNDDELELIRQCEKFYGISVEIVSVDVHSKREEWLQRMLQDKLHTCLNYNIIDGCNLLKENHPIVMCGPDICIAGNANYPHTVSTSYNYYRADNVRFRNIRKTRTLLDFPYSPESCASQYCDDFLKSYIECKLYYENNGLVDRTSYKPVRNNSLYQMYVKALLKARYFKKDILYFGKRTGYENYPSWILKDAIPPPEYNVVIPFEESIPHYELCDGSTRIYKESVIL
jgi:hypothetical protein